MGDDSGISEVIGSAIKGTVVTPTKKATDGAAKFGQTAISQIMGSPNIGGLGIGDSTSSSEPSLPSEGSLLAGFKNAVGGAVAGVMGETVLKQEVNVEKMVADDEKFSEAAEAQVRAKIKNIYEEHAQKRKREEIQEEQQEKAEEEQKKEIKQLEKKQDMDVSVAQQKASAEKRNMGAE